MGEEYKKISKYLSYILRHKPESIGLTLDVNGWANIDELIEKTTEIAISKTLINEVVKTSDKQRFIISEDQMKIRANQGHSVNIDLNLVAKEPPNILYHGTAEDSVNPIMKEGIKPNSRQYVHLSENIETAWKVGSRHGKPVILTINCEAMFLDGYEFYLSNNGVWLTNYVPSKYIFADSVHFQELKK